MDVGRSNEVQATPSRTDTVTSLKEIELHPLLAEAKFEKQTKPDTSKNNPYFSAYVHKQKHSHYDPKVKLSLKRPKGRISFNEPGKYIKQAEDVRKEEELLQLQKSIEDEFGDLLSDDYEDGDEPINLIDWWDQPFISADGMLNLAHIDEYIYDPEQSQLSYSATLKLTPNTKPLHLTPAERKKMRRERRLLEQREKQERIRFGIDPPEKHKQKLSSLVTRSKEIGAAGNAVSEPTFRELVVREQVKERKEAHEQANLDRIPTKEEKREKLLKKYCKDLVEGEVCSIVVRINTQELSGGSRFKIVVNAHQNHLSGIFCRSLKYWFLLAEGDDSSIRRYKHLLLERLDLECDLVWEGIVKKPYFKNFVNLSKQYPEGSDFEAREALKTANCPHYWQMIQNYLRPE